jgi:RNA polymerase sigma-70 factor (TIGR02960 family)
VEASLLAKARRGDHAAFARLVEGHLRELEVHCYRMLGSAQDAEDALQETLLAAWQGLRSFEGRASLRTWLYRIATTRCLNARRAHSRRRSYESSLSGAETWPEPTRLGEIVWLEPYADRLLDELPDTAAEPAVRYEMKESISLAFITALQHLPARQRAVLILRDVLGFDTAEAATILQSTEGSVTSALKRARASMTSLRPIRPTLTTSSDDDQLVETMVRAWEAGNVDGVVALLADNVCLTMPPMPLEYQDRDAARAFLSAVAFREGRTYRLIPTKANRAPAFGVYLRDPAGGDACAVGLLVLQLTAGTVSAVTRFEASTLARFGLPRSIPDPAQVQRHQPDP